MSRGRPRPRWWSPPRRCPPRDRSARSTGSRSRAPAAAGSGSSARRCRSAAAARPGPSEFGTITVTAAVTLRLDSFITTAECAAAENPRPPYSLGMIIPKKPFRLMKLPHLGRQVLCRCSICHSSSIAHSSVDRTVDEGLLLRRSARAGLKRSSLAQSGLPENRSPSHQTVPASSAMRSVSPIRGSVRETSRMIARVKIARRSGGITAASTTRSTRTSSSNAPRWPMKP